MKKSVIIVALAILTLLPASRLSAQNKFELGGGYAPFFLVLAEDALSVPYKVDAYFEWRYDFGKHWAVGAKVDYKTFKIHDYAYDADAIIDGVQPYGALLAVADFCFCPGKAVNPYIGIGLGPGFIVNHFTAIEFQHEESIRPDIKPGVYPPWVFPVFAPRIGVELFHHLRLSTSVDCDLAMGDTRWPVCFNLGWVF